MPFSCEPAYYLCPVGSQNTALLDNPPIQFVSINSFITSQNRGTDFGQTTPYLQTLLPIQLHRNIGDSLLDTPVNSFH